MLNLLHKMVTPNSCLRGDYSAERVTQQESPSCYEGIGKIRNTQVLGTPFRLPALVLKLAQDVAMIVGLANRHCYTTGTRVIPEAIALSDLPDGFPELGQVILTGDLRDGQQLVATCERLWQGINIWTQGHGYRFISSVSCLINFFRA